MKPNVRIGFLALAALTLSIACARSPDVGKYTCTDGTHCPDGYVCTGSVGRPGQCLRPDAARGDGTPADGPGAARDSADVSIGKTDSRMDGGSGGADGGGATGGAFDGGGQGTGGAAGTGGTKDAAISSGGGSSGNGGTASLPTGRGGATGGIGFGGKATGGVLGLGGSTPRGTGGSSPPGTGGTVSPGTGGTVPPGTGGSTPPGTGGSIPPGTGGRPGTGGSIPPGTGGFSGVTVHLNNTHQTIQGFGINVASMPGSLGSSTINTLYGTSGAGALGLSIMRISMNPDGSLSSSSSDIAAAKSAGAKIIGTTWSAPASCKSNNSTRDGGYLLESCYGSWSDTIVNFAKQHGLFAMSIGSWSDFASCPGVPVCTNSYDTMTFTAKQMVAWVKVAGPKLQAAGIKVIAPEASEWNHVWSNLSATGSLVASYPNSSDPHNCGCFSNTITAAAEATCAAKCLNGDGYDYGHWLWQDQQAWNAFDILGVHEYDSQMAYAWPADVNNGTRDREVWQTDMSGVMHWPEQGPSSAINNGVAVAGWIHSALTVGEASAWLYWWYQAYYQDDNEGLLLKDSAVRTKRYYTLGNYSRFVRPSYVMVGVTGNTNADVLLSAYKGADGMVVIVAINKGTATATVPIAIAGGTAPAICTPNVTSSAEDLAPKTAVSVSGGTFTAALGGTSVTTFVCN